MSNIRIKKGSYSNIGNLQDGDLGFAKYDNNNGTFIIKDGNTTFYTLPKPGESGSLLIGRGLNAAPSYTTGHFVNDTKIAINSTAEPTENLYVNGLFGIGDEALDSGKARTVIYPSKQNPCSSSTCIIFNFGAVGAKRACIEITGHSYSHQLLHSVYEFYVGATNNW